jgi:hypothetical protein
MSNDHCQLNSTLSAIQDSESLGFGFGLDPFRLFRRLVLVRLEKKFGIPEYSLKKEDLEIRKGFIQRIHSTLHLFKAVEIEIHTCTSAMGGEAGLAESLPTAIIDLLEIYEAYFLSMIHFQFTYFFKHSIWKFSEFCTDFSILLLGTFHDVKDGNTGWISSNGHSLLFLRLCAIGTPDFNNKYSSSQLSPNIGFNPIPCRRT